MDTVRWSLIWAEARGKWKAMAFLEGVEPPSWVLGDIVRDAGYPGMVHLSARYTNGVCLVQFPDVQSRSGFSAATHDPTCAVQRDDSSTTG